MSAPINLLVSANSPCSVCWETTRRLRNTHAGAFTVSVVAAVVAGSVSDLCGVPRGDLPELGERLAQHRLNDARSNGADGSSTTWVRAESGRCSLMGGAGANGIRPTIPQGRSVAFPPIGP
jgi:hypothetical protein